MKNENIIRFVQFMHPGGEHKPDKKLKNWKNWNQCQHLRKFIVNPGKYIEDNKVKKDKICFWAEWEPQSDMEKIKESLENGPKFFNYPYFNLNERVKKCGKNTDPFVFGKNFFYTVCQQHHSKGPTYLRYLDKGSVILFGSFKKKSFLLDTVFVVDKWIDYDLKNYTKVLDGKVSETYAAVTLQTLKEEFEVEKSCGSNTLRLYLGVSYDKPVGGMFSFFPSTVFQEDTKGFVKPSINIPDVINNNLKQKFKSNKEYNSISQMKVLWDKVVRQVMAQRLNLGIFSELPEQRY